VIAFLLCQAATYHWLLDVDPNRLNTRVQPSVSRTAFVIANLSLYLASFAPLNIEMIEGLWVERREREGKCFLAVPGSNTPLVACCGSE